MQALPKCPVGDSSRTVHLNIYHALAVDCLHGRADGRCRKSSAILHKWGIHTLGQLAALDKEQLGARLGPEAIRMWERANGQSNRVLKLIRPPESFEESFEFEHEIETAEPLLFMLRRFLEQLAVRLAAIYLVAKELTLRITFAE